MSDQDKAIIWRYRYSLIENGRALGKFLQSARFHVENELKETMRIFKRWSQIELEDALPLLSIKFAANAIYKEEIQHDRQLAKVYNEIRKRAVQCLEKQSTDTIRSILLQLLQAFRYESFESSELRNFFFKRVFENIHICNSFHWLLHLDKENKFNDDEVREHYVRMYEEFMDIVADDYPEYYANI